MRHNGKRLYRNLGHDQRQAKLLYEAMRAEYRQAEPAIFTVPDDPSATAAAVGFVYIVKSGSLWKIGFTKDPWSRLRTLANAGPGLRVLGVHMTRKYVEQELHRQFGAYRKHGEWFALPRGWRGIVRDVLDANPVVL